MYINRKQILEEFLKNIFCLADKNYQERVWVIAKGPECDDIDDTVCDFFDDGNPILEKYKDFGITDIQYNILMNLHDKLREFTDTNNMYFSANSTSRLIKMPEWEEVRLLAKEVLTSFNLDKSMQNVITQTKTEKEIFSTIGSVIGTNFQERPRIETAYSYGSLNEEKTPYHLYNRERINEILKNYKKYGLSEEEYRCTAKFFETLDKYENGEAEWSEVQNAGKEVYKSFGY